MVPTNPYFSMVVVVAHGGGVCMLSHSVVSYVCDCMDCSSLGSSVHGISQARKEYWSGLPLLPPGDLPGLGIELESAALQADT